MKVYIAGPIAGYPDANRHAFRAAYHWLNALGHDAVNPHDVAPHVHEGECPPGPRAGESDAHTAPCYMRTDMIALLGCDAVYFLRGWERSSGAFAEFGAARAAGMQMWWQDQDHAPNIDAAHLERQIRWSRNTFGPGRRTKGVIDRIRKELIEVEADPFDVGEWVDVIILALDGAWRHGAQPQEIIDALRAKQARNELRSWPDWRTASEDHAIEHVREDVR